MLLPSYDEVKLKLPLCKTLIKHIDSYRQTIRNIITKNDPRFLLIVGPCSIHDSCSSLKYAQKLQDLKKQIEDKFFIVMRAYCEKPRSKYAWKGFLYDPLLDGSANIEQGIYATRELYLKLTEMQIPIATEFLEPLAVPYLEDLVSWGAIGARTSASQIHRQLVSDLKMPIGFKNQINGQLNGAIDSILVAKEPHKYFSVNSAGKIAIYNSFGNEYTHLVLRGSEKGPNYDQNSIQQALNILESCKISTGIVVDCSHQNSNKNPLKQIEVFDDIYSQRKNGNSAIVGAMIESHLELGSQTVCKPVSLLTYGKSITDPCLDFASLKNLIESVKI